MSSKARLRIGMLSLVLISILCACGAPIFRTDNFKPDTELLNRLQPYLSQWATTPPEQSQAERTKFETEWHKYLVISVYNPQTDQYGHTIYLVDIIVDAWGDWVKGYYYVADGYKLERFMDAVMQRVDDHIYIYNVHIG